jgi:outer membrane protein assembly factor BamB
MWGLLLLAAVLGEVGCGGSSNQGSSPGTLLALDAETGTELWRADAPTAGLSMPLAVGGQVFVAGDKHINSDQGKLAAFDAASGKMQWQASSVGFLFGTAANEPRVNQGVVVVLQSSGMVGLDAKTGQELWSPLIDNRRGKYTPPGEPINIAAGNVIVQAHMKSCTELRSLDLNTREPRWTVAPGFIGPEITVEGARMFFVTENCPPPCVACGEAPGILRIVALNLVDGKELWRVDLGPNLPYSYPTHLTSGDGVVVETVRKRPSDDESTVDIVVLDAETGKQLWQKDAVLDPYQGAQSTAYQGTQSTIVANGNIYLATSTAIEALDAKTGERHWQASMEEKRPSLTASDKLVIVASGDAGKVVALNALDGTRLWEAPIPRTDNPVFKTDRHAIPAILGGVVYIAVWGRLEPVTGD